MRRRASIAHRPDDVRLALADPQRPEMDEKSPVRLRDRRLRVRQHGDGHALRWRESAPRTENGALSVTRSEDRRRRPERCPPVRLRRRQRRRRACVEYFSFRRFFSQSDRPPERRSMIANSISAGRGLCPSGPALIYKGRRSMSKHVRLARIAVAALLLLAVAVVAAVTAKSNTSAAQHRSLSTERGALSEAFALHTQELVEAKAGESGEGPASSAQQNYELNGGDAITAAKTSPVRRPQPPPSRNAASGRARIRRRPGIRSVRRTRSIRRS